MLVLSRSPNQSLTNIQMVFHLRSATPLFSAHPSSYRERLTLLDPVHSAVVTDPRPRLSGNICRSLSILSPANLYWTGTLTLGCTTRYTTAKRNMTWRLAHWQSCTVDSSRTHSGGHSFVGIDARLMGRGAGMVFHEQMATAKAALGLMLHSEQNTPVLRKQFRKYHPPGLQGPRITFMAKITQAFRFAFSPGHVVNAGGIFRREGPC